jgi:hypothetical protein
MINRHDEIPGVSVHVDLKAVLSLRATEENPSSFRDPSVSEVFEGDAIRILFVEWHHVPSDFGN